MLQWPLFNFETIRLFVYISLLCAKQKPLIRVHIEDIGGEPEPPPTSSHLPSAMEERPREKQIKTANSQSPHVSPKSSSAISESKTEVTELETPRDVDKNQPSNKNTTPLVTELHVHEDSASSSRVEIPPAQPEGEGTKMEVVMETQKDVGNGTTLHVHVPADIGDQGGQHSVVVPDVPDTSLQFQADWKRLRRDANALTTYFKVQCHSARRLCMQLCNAYVYCMYLYMCKGIII